MGLFCRMTLGHFVLKSTKICKSVYLAQGSERIIYDIENTSNTYDGNMIGKTWTMTNNGLTCFHCDFKTTSTRRSSKRNIDLNDLSPKQLEQEITKLEHSMELKRLNYEKKLNRKKLELEKKMLDLETKLNNSSNEKKMREINF